MMLSVCRYLRLCDIPITDAKRTAASKSSDNDDPRKNVWHNNIWIVNLNYLHLAKAAIFCDDYFGAILFSDIWCQKMIE